MTDLTDDAVREIARWTGFSIQGVRYLTDCDPAAETRRPPGSLITRGLVEQIVDLTDRRRDPPKLYRLTEPGGEARGHLLRLAAAPPDTIETLRAMLRASRAGVNRAVMARDASAMALKRDGIFEAALGGWLRVAIRSGGAVFAWEAVGSITRRSATVDEAFASIDAWALETTERATARRQRGDAVGAFALGAAGDAFRDAIQTLRMAAGRSGNGGERAAN